jgi:hypothetical protein
MSSEPPNPYILLNEKNRIFWVRESKLLEQRIQDPYLFKVATQDMTSEELRGVPLRNRKSMAQAFADAEGIRRYVEGETRKTYHIEFARKGGRAEKSDKLQEFIVNALRRRPALAVPDLLRSLEDNPDFEVDEELIYFKGSNGQEKPVPVSGLKDRLYRAKKKLHSR